MFHDPARGDWGRGFHEKMDMIRHDFDLCDLNPHLLGFLIKQFYPSYPQSPCQQFSPVFWTPDEVIAYVV
jgi:hypothetical protein